MSLPKEPRQKMINIMYLVLTALLALNVSSEILNAFKTVNRSLENTNKTVNLSTLTIMKSLEDKTTDPQTKDRAIPWFANAQKVVATSQGLYDYLETLKNKILTLAGGKPGDPTVKFKEDNLDIVTKLMVKDGEELFFTGDKESLKLPYTSESLKFIRRIRDEVHRFGITFHRKKRSMGTFKNELEDITGIGKSTVNLLLKEFKSVKNIREKSSEELAKVIGKAKAKIVTGYFQK